VKRLTDWLKQHSLLLGITLLCLIFVAGCLLWALGSLTHGISAREVAFGAHRSSLSSLVHNPIGLPQTLLAWLFGLVLHNYVGLRLASAVWGAVGIAAMAYVLLHWYGPRAAWFGSALFVCSAWFLHLARLATTDILLVVAPVVLFASYVLLLQHGKTLAGRLGWVALQGCLLFVPGMIWLMLLHGFWQRRELAAIGHRITSWSERTATTLLILLFVIPLTVGIWLGQTKVTILELLGLPQHVPHLGDIAANAGHQLLFLAIRGTTAPDAWLNHLPILDMFGLIMLVAGLYFYLTHFTAKRSKLLLGVGLISFALASLGGSATISLLVGWLYLLITGGIAYLLHQWLKVFPRNPVARSCGIAIVTIAVAMACLYGLRQYFIAWPHNRPSQNAFEARTIPPARL
jgi:hypothetical protein